MKVSEITDKNLVDYIKQDYDSLTEDEIKEIQTMLGVAKAFVKSYTGIKGDDELDLHEDFVIVVYVLVEDMYDNRTLYVEKNNLNKVVETILGMHSINLL